MQRVTSDHNLELQSSNSNSPNTLTADDEREKLHQKMHWRRHETRRWAGEFIGTFLLVLIHGSLSLLAKSTSGRGLDFTGQGLGAALSMLLLIYVFGPLCGAHFNPCVSISFALQGSFYPIRLPGYLVAQLLGSVVAGAIILAFFGTTTPASNQPETYSVLACFWMEVLLSFILYMTVLISATEARILGPASALPVMGVMGVATYIGGSFGGGSMNVFRSFGPGVLSTEARPWLWIYTLAPFVAVPLAVGFVKLVDPAPLTPEEATAVTGEFQE